MGAVRKGIFDAMKTRDLRIGKYGWRVRFYFAVHGYHTRSILSSLEEIECPGTILERVRGNLLRADMDSGFTYSNKDMRRSVAVSYTHLTLPTT